jgi:cell division protein FtsB
VKSLQKKSSRPVSHKVLIGALVGLLAILQIRLWMSAGGFSEVSRLGNQVELQRHENAQLAERNARLEAEVEDLRGGFAAVEERARSDLGLIAPEETFYVFAGDGDGERVEAR